VRVRFGNHYSDFRPLFAFSRKRALQAGNTKFAYKEAGGNIQKVAEDCDDAAQEDFDYKRKEAVENLRFLIQNLFVFEQKLQSSKR